MRNMATMYGQDNLGQNGLASNNEEEDKKEVKAGSDVKIMTETNNVSSAAKSDRFVNKDANGVVYSDDASVEGDDQEVGKLTEKENLKPGIEDGCNVVTDGNAHIPIDIQEKGGIQDLQTEVAGPTSCTVRGTADEDLDKVMKTAKEPKTDECIPTTTNDAQDCSTIPFTDEVVLDNTGDNQKNEAAMESCEDSDEEDSDEDSKAEDEVIIMADMEAISEAVPLLEVPERVPDEVDVVDSGMPKEGDREVTLCSGIDVFLYRIPVEKGLRLEKAKDWDLRNPILTGTLSFTKTSDAKFVLSIYDDDDGGALHAKMELNHYPSPKLYQTKDSTRYFIAALKNAKDGCTSALGIGFYCSKEFIQVLATNVTPEPTFEPPMKRSKTESKTTGRTDSNAAKKTAQILREYAEAKYGCQFCSERCGTKEQLKKHWADDHGLRHPSHCPYCLDPFPSEKAMKMHREVRHQHACNKCTLIFVNANEYLQHAYDTHGFGLK